MRAVINYIQGNQMQSLEVTESLDDLLDLDKTGGSFLYVHPLGGEFPVMLNKAMIASMQTKTDFEQQRKVFLKQQAKQQESDGKGND